MPLVVIKEIKDDVEMQTSHFPSSAFEVTSNEAVGGNVFQNNSKISRKQRMNDDLTQILDANQTTSVFSNEDYQEASWVHEGNDEISEEGNRWIFLANYTDADTFLHRMAANHC